MHKLFVYGTLKKGYGNHGYIGGSKLITQSAVIDGYDMYSLGGFPGVVKGKGTVYGELYEIDDETLGHCDLLEGYRAKQPDNSMYIRTDVTCTIGDDLNDSAFIYLWNGPIDGYKHLDKGVW